MSNYKKNISKPEKVSNKLQCSRAPDSTENPGTSILCKIPSHTAAAPHPNPSRPPLPNKAMAYFDPDGDLFMKIAMSAYDEHLRELVPCSRCGRKFFPDRISKHEPNCNAERINPVVATNSKTLSIQPNPYSFNPPPRNYTLLHTSTSNNYRTKSFTPKKHF